jgi:7-carboxy-7-deazaguanine synthase
MTTYQIKEVFYSIQGEGLRAGTSNVFVRFAGCNMACAMQSGQRSPGGFDCDTNFADGQSYSLDDLIVAVQDCGGQRAPWVICTGGEPTLQMDAELIDALRAAGYCIAVETNGTRPVPENVDWISMSPKVAEEDLQQLWADELRYVMAHGQPLPSPVARSPNWLLSPRFENGIIDRTALHWCIKLVKSHPQWRLSVQQHKFWGVR